ncbi:MAG TPA: sterol desaturase family protein [Rickettsiales bacterium]|nr:sterol desaturase family protein [Rickettsiales bacterium]
MSEQLSHIGDMAASFYMQMAHWNIVTWFLVCGAVFMSLAVLFPSKRDQPLIHKGMIPDTLYWFFSGPLLYVKVNVLINRGLVALVLALGIYTTADMANFNAGVAPLNKLPVLAQAFLILLIMDFMQYWTHRMFHTMHFWKFHSIHHSPKNVDWLTSVRFHPVNIIIHSTMVGAVVYMLGFSAEAWAVLLPFNMIYSPLVHANVNWTYGPFRYFLASPTFHRWHHTHMAEGGSKNFAPTFPFLDILFGTYYDPKDKRPTVFGAEHDDIPENVLDQLAYPFIKKRKKVRADNGEVRDQDQGLDALRGSDA